METAERDRRGDLDEGRASTGRRARVAPRIVLRLPDVSRVAEEQCVIDEPAISAIQDPSVEKSESTVVPSRLKAWEIMDRVSRVSDFIRKPGVRLTMMISLFIFFGGAIAWRQLKAPRAVQSVTHEVAGSDAPAWTPSEVVTVQPSEQGAFEASPNLTGVEASEPVFNASEIGTLPAFDSSVHSSQNYPSDFQDFGNDLTATSTESVPIPHFWPKARMSDIARFPTGEFLR